MTMTPRAAVSGISSAGRFRSRALHRAGARPAAGRGPSGDLDAIAGPWRDYCVENGAGSAAEEVLRDVGDLDLVGAGVDLQDAPPVFAEYRHVP